MARYRRQLREQGYVSRIIGCSPAIEALRRMIARVAPTDATVLILGERGTGKELVAREIQERSHRGDRPFVIVNCAALPAELLASELFGHERGAFTGAVDRKVGLVTQAAGGTLFLDEVGDLSPAGQAMQLRFLQEGEVRPVGALQTSRVDIRVVAATNRDLRVAVRQGQFRADLYDRLDAIAVDVAPLRERMDDVPVLTDWFVARYAQKYGVRIDGVTPPARRALLRHSWPGNVRELEKAVGRAVIHCGGDGWIRSDHLGLPYEEAVAGTRLSSRQQAVLTWAADRGCVRRRDLTARFGISGEVARRDLAGLVNAGLLRRTGTRRGTRYTPATRP